MSRFDLHPAARVAIDERGEALVKLISEFKQEAQKPLFRSKRDGEFTIPKEDIIGEVQWGRIDITGQHVARAFEFRDAEYELAGDSYQALRRLAEVVLKHKEIRASVRPIFLEEKIFEWCRDKFRGSMAASLSGFLLVELERNVHKTVIWIPLAETEIETSFAVGNARVEEISQTIIESLDRDTLKNAPPDAVEIVKRHLADRKRKLLGRTAVMLELEGEKDFVFERAVELADIVVGFLIFFSPPAVTPWASSLGAILGAQPIATAEAFTFEDGRFANYQSAMRADNVRALTLSTLEVREHLKNGLAILGDLLNDSGLNEFQRNVRNAILTFSKGIATTDLNDRLMYTFAALESVLIKGSEPIQQNLGERIAFMLEKDPSERRKVVKAVRDAYELRSRFVHRSLPITEASALEEICLIAWKAAFQLIPNSMRFGSTGDFIDAVDAIKFGAQPNSG